MCAGVLQDAVRWTTLPLALLPVGTDTDAAAAAAAAIAERTRVEFGRCAPLQRAREGAMAGGQGVGCVSLLPPMGLGPGLAAESIWPVIGS